jgi:exopolyphosphatase/guanosine-5'-triphosphate,3'-diphosphate pyrophosphatase
MEERRLAVVDLGSNSFRLVVFTWEDGSEWSWWKRTDEIYEPVRVGEGQAEGGGPLQAAPMERALETIELFAHFCRATGIRDVRPLATSAIREASNREEFLRRANVRSGLDVQVLSQAEEARYGYLAAVNSTTLTDGVALDIGGGSMQLTRVGERRATTASSWRLGAVVTTEKFLTDPRVKPKHLKTLRAHVREELSSAPWVAPGVGDLAGVGGAIRNLAAAAMLVAGMPSYGVQGFRLERGALDDLVEQLAEATPAERRRIPGIKPERGDVILGAAVVVQSVMERGGFDSLEVTDAGLREGVFFSVLLDDLDPPLFPDVRRASVKNLAGQYDADTAHTDHVAVLALHLWDEMAAAGAHPAAREERELLWAAAMLHDIGVAVDYDDHHKHSRYLILNAGLPGFSPRETALIGQMARYHRKGQPTLGEFEPLMRRGDDALLTRCAAVLRVAEQLERPRDQSVRRVHVSHPDGRVELRLESDVDVTVPRWAAEREGDIFALAFGRDLAVVA